MQEIIDTLDETYKNVFVGEDLTKRGRSFHNLGPVTAKARSPLEDVLVG